MALLAQLQEIFLQNCPVIFPGDGEFDGIELQSAIQTLGRLYACQ